MLAGIDGIDGIDGIGIVAATALLYAERLNLAAAHVDAAIEGTVGMEGDISLALGIGLGLEGIFFCGGQTRRTAFEVGPLKAFCRCCRSLGILERALGCEVHIDVGKFRVIAVELELESDFELLAGFGGEGGAHQPGILRCVGVGAPYTVRCGSA